MQKIFPAALPVSEKLEVLNFLRQILRCFARGILGSVMLWRANHSEIVLLYEMTCYAITYSLFLISGFRAYGVTVHG